MNIRIKSRKRNLTWEFLIAFLLGCIFAELTADPISDALFFWRSSRGPLSPVEQVLYWYFLPACVYTAILILAFLTMKLGGKAASFAVIIVCFAGFSLILSWRILGGSYTILLLLAIPFIAFAYILFRRSTVRIGKHKVSL